MSKLTRKWEEQLDSRFESAGICSGGIFDCDCACAAAPAAPNYQPVADASKESSEVMAALGREQLAEAKRQYDLSSAVAKPVVDAQLDIMQQTKDQGQDYYDYMVSQQRPIEEALNREAIDAGSDQKQQEAADKAVADSQGGYTRAINQAIRQGLRYGVSPTNATGGMAVSQAQNTVAAAGAAREQEKNIGYAKKLDVAGLYRGLPGASQGAYASAINSGSSAVANQMAPGGALMSGMGQGAGTIGTGRSMAMNGTLGILGAQTSYNNTLANVAMANANMEASGSGGFLSGISSLGMAAGGLGWAPFASSDRRLKENIELVGKDERTGLNLYEFNYIDNDDARFRGVMADEVESVMPLAVHYDDMGFASVDYDMLGIKMEEV